MTVEQEVQRWVKQLETLCQPSAVHWCTGTPDEFRSFCDMLVAKGTFIRLNQQLRPNSFLCRTDASDAQPDQQSTLVCTRTRAECSQTRQWADPEATKREVDALLAGSMKGRTMYVVPATYGPTGTRYARLGVTVTDSPFIVVHSMLMSEVGVSALSAFPAKTSYMKIVHSVGQPLAAAAKDNAWPCNAKSKKAAIFPDEHYAVQFGTSLGLQDLVAHLASTLAQKEGWIAAKGIILSVWGPQKAKDHICAILPPGCGKTSLATMIPATPGWHIGCISDDRAWLFPGVDGQWNAVNPRSGNRLPFGNF